MNNKRTVTPYLESILTYAAAGQAVFPCAYDKSPLTKNGFYDAINDKDQIIAWWTKWPDALIGEPELQLVVDVDQQTHGFGPLMEILNTSAAIKEAFTNTKIVDTRSGGCHIKLNNPQGYAFKNLGGKGSLWTGIDFRTVGGYTIVPPSPGYTDRNDLPRADVPKDFWDLCEAKRAEKNAGKHTTTGFGFESSNEAIHLHERNNTLFAMACSLQARGYSKESIEGVVRTENNRCEPPLDDHEVETIIAQALKYEQGEYHTNGTTVPVASPNGTIHKHPVVRTLNSFPITNYEFFLYPYIPFGMVTALSGKGGSGKGTFCNSILVAPATTGTIGDIEEPDAPKSDVTQPMSVLIFTLEDSPGAKILPEVKQAGGDTNRVFICNKCNYDGKEQPFTFTDATVFDEAFAEAFADGKRGLVIIDNAGDFGAKNDGHNYKEVTSELSPITDLAKKYNAAVVLAMHHNKTGSFMGSAAYENKVRSHVSYQKQNDAPGNTVCVLKHEKTNLFWGPSLLFGADKHQYPELKHPVWQVFKIGLAPKDDKQTVKEEKQSEQNECTDWLQDLIADDPINHFHYMELTEALNFTAVHRTRAMKKLGAGFVTIKGIKHIANAFYIANHVDQLTKVYKRDQNEFDN